MKKIISILFVLFCSSKLLAPEIQQQILVGESNRQKMKIDIEQVCFIESNNKSNVISQDGACGLMQITPIALKEWNIHNKDKPYTYKQLKVDSINVKIGTWFLNERIPDILVKNNIPLTINHRLMSYNWGPYSVIKWYKKGANYNNIPEETKCYLTKYWSKYE